MTLRLTPDALRAAYEYLRTTLPFKRWGLPHGEEVAFCVTRDATTVGHYRGDKMRNYEGHEIGISECLVGSTHFLLQIMAHEMIHLYQRMKKRETNNTQHNADFRRQARLVCKHHIFDTRNFV